MTIDYKALSLLLNKADDEDFLLGGKGYGVEFCAFCDAIRVNHFLVISFVRVALNNTRNPVENQV